MIHSPWLNILEAEGEPDSKQSKEYATALFSVGECLGWVGREQQCYIAHRTLVSAPQVTECCSSDRPCRMENYSSVKPSPNTIHTECIRERECVCVCMCVFRG